jgi:hypothetical protein
MLEWIEYQRAGSGLGRILDGAGIYTAQNSLDATIETTAQRVAVAA